MHSVEELENNDYRNFPSPTYAKSFLAQYSTYLEVDATEWLEAFQTDTTLSNLDSYDYLKEHDEHVGHEVLPLKAANSQPKAPAKKAEPAPEPLAYSPSAYSLQPLVVFAITAMILTAGAFGYRHLSDSISDSELQEQAEADTQKFIEAPSIVHSRPTPTAPISGPQAAPPIVAATIVGEERGITPPGVTQIGATKPLQTETTAVTFDAPPPRAVIIEE
jgi:cytoskeletal protein RodZ